jgi:hypothetical protein
MLAIPKLKIESGMKAGKETYSSERMSRSVAILTRLLDAWLEQCLVVVVSKKLVKERRGVGGLVFLTRRREIAGTGNGALEHEMEHRGAAALNPTKGTFRIRTAPPLKPPLLLLLL